ncbi:hypothetical protein [Microbacterium lushaniae]|uniref:hypothetical protein n=1 Tax=Microbacterium lushaniae TaxID=2614639 RepID=UPI001783DBA8|nr:hypothetical protein [Microbacterium lushaniae]
MAHATVQDLVEEQTGCTLGGLGYAVTVVGVFLTLVPLTELHAHAARAGDRWVP